MVLAITLYKKFCKNVISRGHLVVFYQLFPLLYCIGHIENNKNLALWFLTFSVFEGGNVREMYYQYFQNKVLKISISCDAQLIITWYSFSDYLDPFTVSAPFSKFQIIIKEQR